MRVRSARSDRAGVETMPDAALGITGDRRIRMVNEATERLFGYPREHLLEWRIEQLFVTTERLIDAVDDARGSATGTVSGLVAARDDGTTFPADVAISGADGTGAELLVVTVRITDQQRIATRFRGLLETAPDAIVAVTSDGRIAMVSQQAERLFGYGRDAMIGQPVHMLIPRAARHRHVGQVTAYFTDPRPRAMGSGPQLEAQRRDGTTFPAEISLSALETDIGVLTSAAVRDITDRVQFQVRLEAQLHQAQRLESLGQLAGGVAHDFNNLLGAISGYTTFVTEAVAAAAAVDDRWQSVADDLGQIRQAAERAARLVHQLLAFGRRDVTHPRVLDLNQVFTELEPLLHRTLGEHITLRSELQPDLWPINADPGQIEQVLVNLAVNARDAMPHGGTLTVTTRNVSAGGSPEGENRAEGGIRAEGDAADSVRLGVSDTGSGMDEATIAKAFEPFFSTKPKGAGTGLGLATVYGIVAQAGGDTHIASRPDAGTTVTASFPATDEAAQPSEETMTDTPATGTETILTVEDEDAMREVTRRILSRNGYQAITCASGEEALERARQYDGDLHLLLTDVVMPGMLGRELADKLRTIRPSIHVLYMSGYDHQTLTTQGIIDPGVVLVPKPFSEPTLIAKIRELLDTPS